MVRGSVSRHVQATKKVEIPQLAWKVISEESIKLLREIEDVDEVAR